MGDAVVVVEVVVDGVLVDDEVLVDDVEALVDDEDVLVNVEEVLVGVVMPSDVATNRK